MATVFASDQTCFLQSSFAKMTAHMASSPLCAAAVGLPLSPRTSASMPRSTMAKSMACTARLSLWFLVRRLAERMSERMVFRMNARRDAEDVRGSRGKRVLRRLGGVSEAAESRGHALDGGDHMLVAEEDEVLDECLAGVRCEWAGEERREMPGKVDGLVWVARRDVCDKGDELAQVGCVVVRAEHEEGPGRVVVAVLLQKLFLVRGGIAPDQILQLGQVRGQDHPMYSLVICRTRCSLIRPRRRRGRLSTLPAPSPSPSPPPPPRSPAPPSPSPLLLLPLARLARVPLAALHLLHLAPRILLARAVDALLHLACLRLLDAVGLLHLLERILVRLDVLPGLSVAVRGVRMYIPLVAA